jgi:sulfur carrier protein ThiS
VRVDWDGQVYEFDKPMIISKLLDQFSLSKEAYLVVVNGRLTTEDCKLGRDDRVKLIRVISGG